MECVLHDFTEDIGNGLLDLLVDSALDVGLWVGNVDVVTLVAVIVEDKAIAVIVKVKEVLGRDGVAITWVEGVVTFYF